jgi:hypothetical protein
MIRLKYLLPGVSYLETNIYKGISTLILSVLFGNVNSCNDEKEKETREGVILLCSYKFYND